MKILTTTILILLAFYALCAAQSQYGDNDILTAKINSAQLQLLVAKSDAAKAKGLGGRLLIPKDGMIFFFDKPQELVFWMRDMFFPIDIVWILDKKIVGFAQNAQPEPKTPLSNLKRYRSPSPANTVIELKAGEIKRLKLKIGDILDY
jgi:uncharacterized membrane protein (UPF0127 family)